MGVLEKQLQEREGKLRTAEEALGKANQEIRARVEQVSKQEERLKASVEKVNIEREHLAHLSEQAATKQAEVTAMERLAKEGIAENASRLEQIEARESEIARTTEALSIAVTSACFAAACSERCARCSHSMLTFSTEAFN